MSGTGMNCGDFRHPCTERSKPVSERAWVVVRRNYRCSAFDGYHRQWSPYSDVSCLNCGALWRTKADYVSGLSDAKGNAA